MKFIDKKNIRILRPRTTLVKIEWEFFRYYLWISMNSKVPVFNNGKNLYQFVDARDFIDATHLSAFKLFGS